MTKCETMPEYKMLATRLTEQEDARVAACATAENSSQRSIANRAIRTLYIDYQDHPDLVFYPAPTTDNKVSLKVEPVSHERVKEIAGKRQIRMADVFYTALIRYINRESEIDEAD